MRVQSLPTALSLQRREHCEERFHRVAASNQETGVLPLPHHRPCCHAAGDSPHDAFLNPAGTRCVRQEARCECFWCVHVVEGIHSAVRTDELEVESAGQRSKRASLHRKPCWRRVTVTQLAPPRGTVT